MCSFDSARLVRQAPTGGCWCVCAHRVICTLTHAFRHAQVPSAAVASEPLQASVTAPSLHVEPTSSCGSAWMRCPTARLRRSGTDARNSWALRKTYTLDADKCNACPHVRSTGCAATARMCICSRCSGTSCSPSTMINSSASGLLLFSCFSRFLLRSSSSSFLVWSSAFRLSRSRALRHLPAHVCPGTQDTRTNTRVGELALGALPTADSDADEAAGQRAQQRVAMRRAVTCVLHPHTYLNKIAVGTCTPACARSAVGS